MSLDLLQLDKDCAMPTLLRRKWKEFYGYDPVIVGRRADAYGVIALLCLVIVGLDFLVLPLVLGLGSLVFVGLAFLPLSLISAILYYYSAPKSFEFARALEKLPLLLTDGWSPSVEVLCNFDERTL